MERVILIKYGELTTKKGNRSFFVKTLVRNIEQKLKDYDVEIEQDLARMLIHFKEEQKTEILTAVQTVFGIHAYHVAYQVPSSLEIIKEKVLETAKQEKFTTFKVEVKRNDKSFPVKSMDLAPLLGGLLLKNITGIQVDVHSPDVKIEVEITPKHTYIYYQAYQGLGGYPVGTQGKALLMLSGGIDSPVAGFMAMKRGIPIEAVYFEAIPHTSLEAREKVITLCKKLANYTDEIKLHIVPFTKLQEAIYQNVNPNYMITIMRRMMYRIMDNLCQVYHGYAIINGESIGQVASQTLESMQVINEVTTLPVIRPVACLDKLEIIALAKKIDTYETSVLPYEDCCTVFVPRHPVIHPTLDKCLSEEAKFDYLPSLEETIEQVFTLKITAKNEKTYQDLL